MNQNEITPQDHAAEEITSIASLPDANDSIVTPPPLMTVDDTATAYKPDAVAELESTGGYVPTFNDLTRTVIYVVCGILGLLGAACAAVSYTTGGPAWLTMASVILGFIAPYVANMFGVAYNPLKMASR